jgi:hypothetical protein
MKLEKNSIAFSTNDPPNTYIPDTLGPVIYEFIDSFVYILDKSSDGDEK